MLAKDYMRKLMDQLDKEMGEVKVKKTTNSSTGIVKTNKLRVSEFTSGGKKKLMEDEFIQEEVDPILGALQNAYTFLTQPQKMMTRGKSPTILTYHTSRYNEMATNLREAIKARVEENKSNTDQIG